MEMVTTFTHKPSLVKINARNFELSWQQTHKQTHPQTGPITIHCAAASACKYLLGAVDHFADSNKWLI